jgi:hypothetical protein
MLAILNSPAALRESDFKIGKTITCRNKMDRGYEYTLTAPYGAVQIPGYFEPNFTPGEMLAHGVFEGKYMNDCLLEFPKEWFLGAKHNLSPTHPDVNCNYFKIKSRQSLKIWQQKGWLYGADNRGWFQWYCRYYCGRRDAAIDEIQIKRWRAFKRHYGQVVKNCPANDGANGVWCRPKQRQALLQWAYPCF